MPPLPQLIQEILDFYRWRLSLKIANNEYFMETCLVTETRDYMDLRWIKTNMNILDGHYYTSVWSFTKNVGYPYLKKKKTGLYIQYFDNIVFTIYIILNGEEK